MQLASETIPVIKASSNLPSEISRSNRCAQAVGTDPFTDKDGSKTTAFVMLGFASNEAKVTSGPELRPKIFVAC